MENQLYIFTIFILTGFVLGILFDIFRIVRKSFKTNDFITCIEDFIFWIISGLLLMYCIFKFNNGELRLFIFIGILVGCVLYVLTISKVFIKSSMFIINIIKKVIYYLIIIPSKFIYNIFKQFLFKPFTFIIINLKKNLSKPIIKLKKINIKKEKFNSKKDLT